MKKLLILAAVILGTTCATAQTAENGKVVKRILFDRENVTVIYADDTSDKHVQTATITSGKPETTGIKSQDKTPNARNKRGWYTLDGRRMTTAPSTRNKGVYVVKEDKKVIKVVKK
jgi:hypothetical protein